MRTAGGEDGFPWDHQQDGGGGGVFLNENHKDEFERLFENFYVIIKDKRRIPKGSKSFS